MPLIFKLIVVVCVISICPLYQQQRSEMGYDTEFTGELYFKQDVTNKQIALIKSMCGEDCRDHPEWECDSELTYIDLELNDDYSGIKWNGSEKTYDLADKINLIVKIVRQTWPDFDGFEGQIKARGEYGDSDWLILCHEDGTVYEHKLVLVGDNVTCPSCGHRFKPEVDNESD